MQFEPQLFENLLKGCQVVDKSFRYVYLNHTALKQIKKAKEQLVNEVGVGLL